VKPAVGLVSLAAAEDDDEEEQLSPSMRRLLREAAAADELESSGGSSPLAQQEHRQHSQQLLQHQGSNSSSLGMQDDVWDCSAHGSFRAVSLTHKSKSVPEGMPQVQDEQQQRQQQQFGVHLTSAHSAPAEIGAGALLHDSKVHHGKLMMPLSAPLAAQGESLQQPQQLLPKQQQKQQAAMFSQQLLQAKQQQQSGTSVCYGWELSPSGAASPCGAVHSTMLDLFADMAEEEVVLCRYDRLVSDATHVLYCCAFEPALYCYNGFFKPLPVCACCSASLHLFAATGVLEVVQRLMPTAAAAALPAGAPGTSTPCPQAVSCSTACSPTAAAHHPPPPCSSSKQHSSSSSSSPGSQHSAVLQAAPLQLAAALGSQG
jgi:hypothetical protein